MHVDTGGELAADGNINALPAASRVLFNQDEFQTLIVTLKNKRSTAELLLFLLFSVVLPICSD